MVRAIIYECSLAPLLPRSLLYQTTNAFFRNSSVFRLFSSSLPHPSLTNQNEIITTTKADSEAPRKAPTRSTLPSRATRSGTSVSPRVHSPHAARPSLLLLVFPSRACTQWYVVFLTNLYISYCLCPIISLLLTDHIHTAMIIDAQASNRKVRSRSQAKTTRTSTASPRTTGTAALSPSSRRRRRQG